EHSSHGINTSRQMAKSVTHVSGTICHLSLRSGISGLMAKSWSLMCPDTSLGHSIGTLQTDTIRRSPMAITFGSKSQRA
ncbi:MAG: hypothetical protein P8Y53_11565, partial [Pseudolabrys sp.]